MLLTQPITFSYIEARRAGRGTRAGLQGIAPAVCLAWVVCLAEYFGIIEPLRASGGADRLPTPLIVSSAVLGAALLIYLG
jgi:hypothetical protein